MSILWVSGKNGDDLSKKVRLREAILRRLEEGKETTDDPRTPADDGDTSGIGCFDR